MNQIKISKPKTKTPIMILRNSIIKFNTIRFSLLIIIVICLIACTKKEKNNSAFAINVIVVERGTFKTNKLTENSILLPKHAINFNRFGSKFNFYKTLYSGLIINHTLDYQSLIIGKNIYGKLNKYKLSIGEDIL